MNHKKQKTFWKLAAPWVVIVVGLVAMYLLFSQEKFVGMILAIIPLSAVVYYFRRKKGSKK